MAHVSRLLVFSSRPPGELVRLLDHLQRELTDAKVCGVLYQEPRNYGTRPAFRRFVSFLSIPVNVIIRFIHACPRNPNPPTEITLNELHQHVQQRGCELLVATNAQSAAARDFVERQKADLGVVYGDSVLPKSLVRTPRLGSIGLTVKSAIGNRAAEPIGLWEDSDDPSTVTVAVRKIDEALEQMPILRQATITIERYDNLKSLALKDEVVGRDLLVGAIADQVTGKALPVSQIEGCKVDRTDSPRQTLALERKCAERKPRYSPKRTRPVWKLFIRSIFFLPVALLRNWLYRWRKSFPVVIFYHHIISDRPHHLGTPTAAFARQLGFLRKFYRIASLEEAMQMLQRGSVPAPTIVLTFDDGYADNFVNLRAVAERYKTPVFLFVSTAHMESGSPFAHDLKRNQNGFAPFCWDQVKTLSRSGFSFGCHTRAHFDCGSVDGAKLKEEIAGSKTDLISHAGIYSDYFSFPWGLPENISEEGLRVARSSFQYVFAAAGGVNVVGVDPRGALLKREDHPASLWEVELSAQCLLNMKSWRDIFPGIF